MRNIQTIINIILAVLLVLVVGYIVVGKYTAYTEQKTLDAARFGYEQAIIQLVQQVSTCQQVPLIVGNYTVNVVAVECLQQPAT